MIIRVVVIICWAKPLQRCSSAKYPMVSLKNLWQLCAVLQLSYLVLVFQASCFTLYEFLSVCEGCVNSTCFCSAESSQEDSAAG